MRNQRRRLRALYFTAILLGAPLPAIAQVGIAAGYPGDIGIGADSRVIFVEDFESGSIAELSSRWEQVENEAGMSWVSDVPLGSAGQRALRMTTGGSSTTGGHLYTRLPTQLNTLHLRYYVRYGAGVHHHTSGWLGGYNPPTPYPQGGAGERPVGNERFTIAFDTQSDRMDFYNYYMGMRGPGGGFYWGNSFIQDPNLDYPLDEWMCVEVMVKLNEPVSASNGELALWVNGQPITHLGPGFPNGTWGPGVWTPDSNGTPFEGFQWRSDGSLRINFLWLLFYTTGNPPGFLGRVDWDHVVAATEYIGTIAVGAPEPSTLRPPRLLN